MLYRCVWKYGPETYQGVSDTNDGKGYQSESAALWHGERLRTRLRRADAEHIRSCQRKPCALCGAGIRPLGTLAAEPFYPNTVCVIQDW